MASLTTTERYLGVHQDLNGVRVMVIDFTRLQQAYLLARSLAEDPKTSALDRVAYAQIANLIAEACSGTSLSQTLAIRV